MSYVDDTAEVPQKQGKELTVPCVYYKGRNLVVDPLTALGHRYVFHKGVGLKKPITEMVVSLGDLEWFNHEERSNVFVVCLDKKWVPEETLLRIHRTLPKAIELVKSWKVQSFGKDGSIEKEAGPASNKKNKKKKATEPAQESGEE